MILRLDAGLSTYEREVAESTGLDFDDISATLKQEREIVSAAPVPAPVMPTESTDDKNPDEEDTDNADNRTSQ